jgi:hypothetical protein
VHAGLIEDPADRAWNVCTLQSVLDGLELPADAQRPARRPGGGPVQQDGTLVAAERCSDPNRFRADPDR